MMTLLEQEKDRVVCKEISIPIRNESSVRALVFSPRAPESEPRPLVVLMHGGGFLFGTAEMEAAACIAVTSTYGCVSMSIEYRLSPEVKFPVAYEDCWDALQWVRSHVFQTICPYITTLTPVQIASHAADLGANTAHGFILGGTSSGGQTAAALSHWARDTPLAMPLTGIYLNVPATVPEPSAVPDKYREFYQSRAQNNLRDSRVSLSEKTQSAFEKAVEPDKHSELWNPLIWPSGHHGLPPTYFQVCGEDILRDDALIYERILRLEYNVATKVDVYPGLPHVFWYLHPGHSACAKFVADTTKGLGWLLEQTAGP